MVIHDACDCCSPLHVAVVQEDRSLVQQILQTLLEMSAPVDCYNNLRQVCILNHCHYQRLQHQCVIWIYLLTVNPSHTRRVVRECSKDDDQSQWARPKFDPHHP